MQCVVLFCWPPVASGSRLPAKGRFILSLATCHLAGYLAALRAQPLGRMLLQHAAALSCCMLSVGPAEQSRHGCGIATAARGAPPRTRTRAVVVTAAAPCRQSGSEPIRLDGGDVPHFPLKPKLGFSRTGFQTQWNASSPMGLSMLSDDCTAIAGSGTLVNKVRVQSCRAIYLGYVGNRTGSFERIGIDRCQPGYACYIPSDDSSCGQQHAGTIYIVNL